MSNLMNKCVKAARESFIEKGYELIDCKNLYTYTDYNNIVLAYDPDANVTYLTVVRYDTGLFPAERFMDAETRNEFERILVDAALLVSDFPRAKVQFCDYDVAIMLPDTGAVRLKYFE